MTRRRSPHVLVLPSWYPTPWSPQRGIFFREQARALRRAGVRVGVAYPELRRLRTLGRRGAWRNRFQASVEEEEGIPTSRVHGWNVPSGRLRARLFVALARRVVDRYREGMGEPDLLHAHGALWAGVAAERLARERALPFVLTEHSSALGRDLLDDWQLGRVRRACSGATRVMAVSRFLADDLERQADASDVSVVPNLVDTDFFTQPPWERSSPPFELLTVATLRPNKRVDLLLQAFARAFPENETIRLVVAGDGRSRSDLQRSAAELGVAERVDFTGRLSREEVRRAMWRANVYVLTSDVETFGISLVEAMATGLPVVATRSGGPQEVVFEEAGWLVKPGDPAAMESALLRAYEAEPRLRARAETIRRGTVERYGEEAVTARLRDVYRSALRETPPGEARP